jgi:DUF4097 and DUF4098 domain-containing protein YvlB
MKMKSKLWTLVGVLVFSVAGVATMAGDFDFNKSIRVGDGEARDGDLSTLNGKIDVGDGATVRGECESVNGSIDIGRGAVVESVSAVNGNIEIDADAEVEKSVDAVNGRVSLEPGARAESVSTVNGTIKLTGAEVDENVTTVNGDILLRDATRVGGDVVVEEVGGRRGKRPRPIRIELEGGSVIEGNVIVEDPENNPVELFLRDGSRVVGRVQGAEIVER